MASCSLGRLKCVNNRGSMLYESMTICLVSGYFRQSVQKCLLSDASHECDSGSCPFVLRCGALSLIRPPQSILFMMLKTAVNHHKCFAKAAASRPSALCLPRRPKKGIPIKIKEVWLVLLIKRIKELLGQLILLSYRKAPFFSITCHLGEPRPIQTQENMSIDLCLIDVSRFLKITVYFFFSGQRNMISLMEAFYNAIVSLMVCLERILEYILKQFWIYAIMQKLGRKKEDFLI